MDTKLLEALYWKGVPVFDMGSHMSTIDVGWGSPTFHKMGREKVILIDAVLPFGFELLMCDTDMVWLKVFFYAFYFLFILVTIYWANCSSGPKVYFDKQKTSPQFNFSNLSPNF